MLALIPLPYRLLLAVIGLAAIFGGGFAVGFKQADQRAKVAAQAVEINQLKSDATRDQTMFASAMAEVKQYQSKIAELSEVSDAATARADAAEQKNAKLEQEYSSYADTLAKSPTCFLSDADVSGLRAIGAHARSGHRAKAIPTKLPPAEPAAGLRDTGSD